MKNFPTAFLVVLFLNFSWFCHAQTVTNSQSVSVPPPTPYTVVSRDANSRVWEKMIYESLPSGKVVPHKHCVTELATGLNYWDGRQWSPSIPSFQISDDGQSVFATNLQHKVRLAANLNAESSVSITTPDGIVLHTTPVAIGVYDEATSNSVIIAAITNCSATLISSNQVVYENAFDNVSADIVYTLKRGSFSQNVVLKQDIDPADYGCSSNSIIQIFTEFYHPPKPITEKRTLRFGQLVFGQGRAYTAASTNQTGGAPVTKEYKTIRDRSFLIESVKFSSLQNELRMLSRANVSLAAKTNLIKTAKTRYARIPSPRATTEAKVLTGQPQQKIARIDRQGGVVVDYEVLDGPGPAVFQGDTTYLISGEVDLESATFEGGTILKFVNNNSDDTLSLSADPICNTGPYSPAVFTAVDDDSIGESMSGVPGSGYTGTIQSGGYGTGYIDIAGSGNSEQLENCRFCYAQQAVIDNTVWLESLNLSVYDCQFINCVSGVNYGSDTNGYILLANCLFGNVNTVVSDWESVGDNLYCYDSTFDNCTNVFSYLDGGSFDEALVAVNSIFSSSGFGDGPNYGSYNGFYNCGGTFGNPLVTDDNPPYQTVGGGNYYLADNAFRSKGTTNIDQTAQSESLLYFEAASNILADLATKTTWSPTVYDATNISSLGTLSPIVPRDTNGLLRRNVDLGYHYAPLDYIFGGCDLYSNLTFTAGTAIGWYETNGADLYAPEILYDDNEPYAISLNDGANLSFTGTATQPDYFVKFDMVQEGGGNNWTNSGFLGGIMFNGNSTIPQLSANFTIFTHRVSEDNLFIDNFANGGVGFQNCEFYTANFATYDMQYANFTNCLFFRCESSYSDSMVSDYYLGYAINLDYDNCTFYNGSLSMNRYDENYNFESSFWQVENCAFDGTAFEWYDADFSELGLNNTLFDYNSYNTNNLSWQTDPFLTCPTNTLEFVGSQDLMVPSYNWQNSWFGSFYLPSDSPLIKMGSTNANLLGLYHFTTQINQAMEGTNIVDIGYHYVATDTNGNPLDSNGDGIPDYIEDPLGNGQPYDGTNWALAILIQPTNQIVMQGSNVTLSVTADGVPPLAYQWYFDGNLVTNATDSSLTFGSVQLTNDGDYFVVITNNFGAITSSIAELIVFPQSGFIPYQSPGYRYIYETNDTLSNFYATNYDDSSWGVGQAGFGNNNQCCSCTLNAKTFWPGYDGYDGTDGGYPLLYIRRHFYIPPGTTNLSLGFTVDNDAQIFLNGVLLTPSLTTNVITWTVESSNVSQAFYDTLDGWAYIYDATNEGHSLMLTNYFYHENCCSNDDLVLNGLSTNIWHTNDNVLAVRVYDDGGVSYYDSRITPEWITTNQSSLGVQIASPTNQNFNAYSNITVTAIVTNIPSDTPPIWVNFYGGTNILGGTNNPLIGFGVSTNNVYQIYWLPFSAGTYVLTAEAADTNGLAVWSQSVINYVNGTPTITITNPVNEANLGSMLVNTQITAALTPAGAAITNISFYVNGVLLGTNLSTPPTIPWSNVTNGIYVLTATATDTNGATGISPNVTVTVEPSNQPPTVYAGPNQWTNLPTAQLTGFVSDDGLPSNFLYSAWSQISNSSGGIVTFGNSNQPITTATFSTNGVYDLQLLAEDGQLTNTSQVQIVVYVTNQPPVVHAGTNQTFILPALPNTNIIPTINLTTIATHLPSLIGVDYYSPSNCVIVSTPGGGLSFQLVFPDGTHTNFSTISNLTDEVYLTAERSTNGGFAIGEMFCGNGNSGEIMRIEPDGSTVGTNGLNKNAWVVLSNNVVGIEPGVFRGGLWLDRTGVWGGDLIVSAVRDDGGTFPAPGDIWRVNSAGQATLIAQLPVNDSYEGITTIPNNTQLYGPWAGKILVGGDDPGDLFAIDTNGFWIQYNFPFGAEDVRVISENENFYACDEDSTLWGAPASEFQGMVGDILIASEGGSIQWVHWDGSQFQYSVIGVVASGCEGVNFAPAGILNIPPVNYVQLNGVVTDDGELYSNTINNWLQLSGPPSMTFDNPALTNTIARFFEPGTNYLQLNAFDGQFTSSDQTKVIVLRNQAPIVNAGPNQVVSNLSTTLYGTVSDDGLPYGETNILWSQVQGLSGARLQYPTLAETSVTFTQGGTYLFMLTADDGQATNYSEVTVTVEGPSLTVSPAYGWPTPTNAPYTVTALLVDEYGNPETNVQVNFQLLGNSVNNGLSWSTNTDTNGFAIFTYNNESSTVGRDYIEASATGCASVTVIKDWGQDLPCDSQVSHSLTSRGCLSMDWPTNDPHFADYYFINETANTPITLSFENPPTSEAMILRDPSNSIISVSYNGQLNFTTVIPGTYLLEVAEIANATQTPAYSLLLSCDGGEIQYPQLGLEVLYNGTNILLGNNTAVDPGVNAVPGEAVYPLTLTGLATNIVLTISNSESVPFGIQDFIVSGDFTNLTSYDGTPDVTIPSQSSTNYTIQFNATSNGLATGSLYIDGYDNDGAYEIYNVSLIADANPSGVVSPQIQVVSPPNGTVFYYPSYGSLASIFAAAAVTNGSSSLNFVEWFWGGSVYATDSTDTNYFVMGFNTLDGVSSIPFGLGEFTIDAAAVDADGGSAVAAPINIYLSDTPPQMQVLYNGTNIPDYGVITLPQTITNVPVMASLVITNPTPVALLITNTETLNDFTNGDFSLVNNVSGNTTYFGATTNLNISFNAISNGIYEGTLSINAPGFEENPYIIYLIGTAIPTGASPVVQIISPTQNQPFSAPANIPITAFATNSASPVNYVDFQESGTNGNIDLGHGTFTTGGYYTIAAPNLAAGSYTFIATAVDSVGRNTPSKPISVKVIYSTNQPPVAVNDTFTVFANSQNNVLNVLANDYDPQSNTLSVIAVEPPATPTHGTANIINNGMAISYTPVPGIQGYPADGFSYEISDGRGGTAWASVLVDVFASALPNIYITNPPTGYTTNAGSIVPMVAYVNPSQYITNVTFYQGQTAIGVGIGTNGFYTNDWLAVYNPCGCGFTAQAMDSFGQVDTSPEINIDVTVPTNGALVADLYQIVGSLGTTPLYDANGIPTIRDGVFQLDGQAYHTQSSNVVWQIGVYSSDGSTLLRNLTPASTGPVGSTNVMGIILTNCDLTTLINGVYDLRLTVSGGGWVTNVDQQFILESNLKLGQFSFSQQDLVIPVNGIPLTVTRTYNSINPDEGDFGYGWTYTLSDMDVQLDETRETIGSGPAAYSIRIGGYRDVTLTLPNGQRTTFYYNPNVRGFEVYPQWTAAQGITANLTPGPDSAQVEEYVETLEGGQPYWYDPYDASDVPDAAYDFPSFTLTTSDGTQYVLDRPDLGKHTMGSGDSGYTVHAWGTPYLAQIIERNTNTITIATNAITFGSPNGATNQILFQRNSLGLISSISDPNGISNGITNGPPAMVYQYDNTGNLLNVLRLTDRTTATYVTNTFTYTNANFPHYITGVINADGTQIAKTVYNDAGQIIEVVDAYGNTNQYIHNTINDTETVIDPLNHATTSLYDTYGNIIAQTNALGEATTMIYDGNNNKTNTVTYLLNGQAYATNSATYSSLNLVLSSTDPLGHTNGFTYDDDGDLLSSSGALGNTTSNYYDSAGDLVSTVDALSNTTVNAYVNGELVSSTDPIGTTTTNIYDASCNLTNSAMLDASGNILSSNTYTYDANGNRLTSTVWRHVGLNWTNATTTYFYDAQNRVIETINPDGGTSTNVYDVDGQQQETIDALGNVTSNSYDALGRLIQTTYPDGTTTSSAYDAAGNRTNSVDQLGRITIYQYDALNRLTNTIYPDNTTSTTVYDEFGRVAQTIDARGTITANGYDAAGRRIAVTNAFGIAGIVSTNIYAYDPNGNQITFTDANGHTTTNVYDALNRQVQVQYPDATTTETVYDADGRSVAQINQDLKTNLFGYDGAGRLIAVTNALNQVTQYQYDEAGNEVEQIDALLRTNLYFYDGQGHRISHTMPGGQSEGFAYDLDGNQIYETNFNGAVITNQYDVNNRLTNVSSAFGYNVTFAYSAAGERTNMLDPSGATVYAYDLRDRLLQKTVNWNNMTNVSLYYSYDANGNVTNIWSSTSNGVNLVYSYDPLNRLTNVLANGSAVAGYAYDFAGNLYGLQYGNGVTNQYQYDSLNRLTNLTWNLSGSTLARFYYRLGATGNRINLNETVGGTNHIYSWQYDNLYRLTNETVSGISGNLFYQYDGVGNRTNRTAGLTLPSQSLIYNPNDWLTNTDKYDSNGNTTNSSGNSYQYDVMNRVTNATVSGVQILITYDGDGNRVSKKVGSTTTYCLVDDVNPSGYAQVLEEWTNNGTPGLSKVYNYGLDLISQRQPNVSTNYFIYDGHGSIRMLTDIGGSTVNVMLYDAYGNLIASNGVLQTSYLYSGQQYDSDLGLYYNRARYLNTGAGRFWTMDTYEGDNEDPLSLHKYLYGADDPVNRIDPSGLDSYVAFNVVGFANFGHVGLITHNSATGVYTDFDYRYGIASNQTNSMVSKFYKFYDIIYIIPGKYDAAIDAARVTFTSTCKRGGNWLSNNCYTSVNDILDAAGVPYPSAPLPTPDSWAGAFWDANYGTIYISNKGGIFLNGIIQQSFEYNVGPVYGGTGLIMDSDIPQAW